jgi:hypothetical protein
VLFAEALFSPMFAAAIRRVWIERVPMDEVAAQLQLPVAVAASRVRAGMEYCIAMYLSDRCPRITSPLSRELIIRDLMRGFDEETRASVRPPMEAQSCATSDGIQGSGLTAHTSAVRALRMGRECPSVVEDGETRRRGA